MLQAKINAMLKGAIDCLTYHHKSLEGVAGTAKTCLLESIDKRTCKGGGIIHNSAFNAPQQQSL